MRARLGHFFIAHERPDQLLRVDDILAAYGDDFLSLHNDLLGKYGDGILLVEPQCPGCGGCAFVRYIPKTAEELALEAQRREYLEQRRLRAQQSAQQKLVQNDIVATLRKPSAAQLQEPHVAPAEIADAFC